MILFRRLAIPMRGLRLILRQPFALFVHVAKQILRISLTLIRGYRVPLRSLPIILGMRKPQIRGWSRRRKRSVASFSSAKA